MAGKIGLLLGAGSALLGAKSATGPMPGLLKPLDTRLIAQKLELSSRGSERGRRDSREPINEISTMSSRPSCRK